MEKAETVLFADETKLSINNGDFEDAIFYFAVSVSKKDVAGIHKELQSIFLKYNYQAETFHATTAFNEKRVRTEFMNDLTEVFLRYKLHTYCYKYFKNDLFESTQLLNKLNNDILKFNNPEFQALFYFLIFLNTYLRDIEAESMNENFMMYFDRNVYGSKDTEAFSFPDERFVIKRMTFSNKKLISLLALPDFFGYLFRKAKISQDKAIQDNKKLEISRLTINCYSSLLRLTKSHLFHLLNVKDESEMINQMFKLDQQP